MTRIEIKGWRKDPAIAGIVAATFPDYRKQTVYVLAADSVTLIDLNWSGGTRCEYQACTIDGTWTGGANKYQHCAPWNNPAEGQSLQIPRGHVVVRGGFFCGKESAMTIYVRPEDMPKRLTQAA